MHGSRNAKTSTFTLSAKDAEAVGLRACLRCRPRSIESIDPQLAKILKAVELIEGESTLSLDDLSTELELSPYHLQRSFKEVIGVSPKKFAEAKKMEKFKSEIKDGSDVTTAMYDAGYGSSSRLYENASETLGMTPRAYRSGGKGMTIEYTITDCELGRILVGRTIKGLCSVAFADDDESLEENLKNEFPNAEIVRDAAVLKEFVDEILKYLGGENRRLDLPLDIQATAFQMKVWEILRKIPYGETVSYSQIAEQLGDKKKVRAVARACATNRIAVVIPCHRVIASSGKLSGYRWGIDRKQRLLEREANG